MICAASGHLVWAEHHDRSLTDDPLVMVDDLANMLAHRLNREIERAAITRSAKQPSGTVGTYDVVPHALPRTFALTPNSFEEAGRFLTAAREADPEESLAHAWRAFWCFVQLGQGPLVQNRLPAPVP